MRAVRVDDSINDYLLDIVDKWKLRARMRLIHYPDDFDVEGSVIAPLRQGTLLDV